MTTALRNALFVLVMLAAAASTGSAFAQLTERDFENTGLANETYTDAVRGVKSDVIYLRPSADFVPSDDVRIEVPKPLEEVSGDIETERWIWIAVFSAVLAFVGLMIFRHGGGIAVSFGGEVKDASRADISDREREADAVLRQPMDQFLQTLMAMADRREALILLVSKALERAADDNEVRLGRAQTARDVLRVLPRTWPHMPSLRELVREVEVVHFGGRDLAEETFQDCLALATPIFRPGAAT